VVSQVTEGNNGDAIACIVVLLNSLAREYDASLVVKTLHNDGCAIFTLIGDPGVINKNISEHLPQMDRAMEHLYMCDCDPIIETVFTRSEMNTFLVSVSLKEVTDHCTWLNDHDITKGILGSLEDPGSSPLFDAIKPTLETKMAQQFVVLESDDKTFH
jgi:hypothetical protein